MLVTALVLGLTLVAAATDIRWHKIYNWNTYPGMIAGLALHGLGTLLGETSQPEVTPDRKSVV